MTKKYCPTCKREREILHFRKDSKRSDGLNAYCKDCSVFIHRKSFIQYKCNFEKFIAHMYIRISHRTKYQPRYIKKNLEVCSKNDFINYAVNDVNLYNLFINWRSSSHILALMPTTDRIDHKKGYTLDNIQFLTHRENTLKGIEEKRMDKILSPDFRQKKKKGYATLFATS